MSAPLWRDSLHRSAEFWRLAKTELSGNGKRTDPWALGSPRKEASWIFRAFVHAGGELESWRRLIDVSPGEEAQLEFLALHEFIPENRVRAAITFRRRTLLYFDRFVAEWEAKRARTSVSVVPANVRDLGISEASRQELQSSAAAAMA
jgi:hypothetical protein